ncbi:MAG: hypothetical protein HWD59_09990 [Coxiellaceae bacterium]|nr:MAG: hypothetical protein HWD59_09990 [Coxiellaceae bacterium]
MLTIEVNDNVTFETLKSVLPLLNLPLPKAITNGAGAEDTKAIYYYPFKNEFPEKELAIEGLSFDPIKDKASLTDWRKIIN